MAEPFRIVVAFFFFIMGLLAFLGSLLQWRWFVNQSKYQRTCRSIGPFAARLLNILGGITMIIMAVLFYLGIIPMR